MKVRFTVHPRVCGERKISILLTKTSTGSSPRVRGTPKVISLKEFPLRFIPACAGNAALPLLSIKPETVHPRVCGERRRWMANHHSRCGSSPRVRGTHSTAGKILPGRRFIPACAGNALGIQVPVACGRFIPACAGNAAWRQCTAYNAAVHPRVCGERYLTNSTNTQQRGSSPRVRGTRARGQPGQLPARFIPACAGNAAADAGIKFDMTVHPRVCGERLPFTKSRMADGGSSPRVRGTLLRALDGGNLNRFIPACAGNAIPALELARRRAVHPRVCGERSLEPRRFPMGTGSSPRVRGTRIHHERHERRSWFIPACAGNALMAQKTARAFEGSSPRVRGTLSLAFQEDLVTRFIPACAGNADAVPVAKRLQRGSSPRVRGTLSWCCCNSCD